jgi:riboflavin transporter FmnP
VATPWGMSLDLIAVPWMIAVLLFGLLGGGVAAVVSTVLLSFMASSGWLGMLAKFLATLPFIIVFALMWQKSKRPSWQLLAGAFLVSLVLRSIIMVATNYYFFLPIWMQVTPEEAIANIPAWMIVLPNIIQSVIDVGIAGFVVYGTKLKERIPA